MKRLSVLAVSLLATTAHAETERQLDAHIHGVGALNIAVSGQTVAMEFRAPGADIVGFEYAPQTDADRTAVDTAIATLSRPMDLFAVPVDAACAVTQASAQLEFGSEEAHTDSHDHDHDHSHDHDHDKDHSHAAEGHSEFHAEYTLTCDALDALTQIAFPYFEMFKAARALEVQIVTEAGAQAFTVTPEAPVLSLQGMF